MFGSSIKPFCTDGMMWKLLGIALTIAVILDSTAGMGVIIHPISQNVTLNSTVRLQCRVQVKPGFQVQWLKDEFGIGSRRKDIWRIGRIKGSNNSRYDLPYNLRNGVYDLQISNVVLADDAQFHCQVDYLKEKKSNRSNKARLNVLVPSKPPQLKQMSRNLSRANPAVVEEKDKAVIRCIAKDGKPGAHLSWSIGGVFINAQHDFESRGINGAIVSQVRRSPRHKKLNDSISTLTLRGIGRLHHNIDIKCTATNVGYEMFNLRPAETRLVVNYGPEVTIITEPPRPSNEFTEHDLVVFRCAALGRPDNFYWTWFINNDKVSNIHDSWYRIRITRTMNQAVFRCRARVTKAGEANVTISVRFAPQFVEAATTLHPASIDDTITMRCRVQSNPPAEIAWTREGSNQVLQRGEEFQRTQLKQSDFGTYVCTATALNFTPISKKIYLSQKGRPIINSGPIVYGRRGRKANIRCSMSSVPLPKSGQIVWRKDGNVVVEDKVRSFDRKNFLGGSMSILYISQVRDKDFGSYNCSVSNGYGFATAIIKLVPQDQIPLPFIAGASVAVVLTLLVVILVLCVCRKGNCNPKYQKGHNHSNGITQAGVTAMELESPCHHENYCQWLPSHQQGGDPNTFIRYGQDIDGSSLRNGSLTRYKGVDLSSCGGTDKMMMQIDEEDHFPEDGYSHGALQHPGMGGGGVVGGPNGGGVPCGIPLPHLQQFHMSAYQQHPLGMHPMTSAAGYVTQQPPNGCPAGGGMQHALMRKSSMTTDNSAGSGSGNGGTLERRSPAYLVNSHATNV